MLRASWMNSVPLKSKLKCLEIKQFLFVILSDDQVKSLTGLEPTFQEIVASIFLSSGILIWEDSHINKQRRSVPDVSREAAG